MKKRKIIVPGKINNDGKLEMYMKEINDFFKLWKGSKVICSFTVVSSDLSEALKGYYFNYVVPTFQQAIRESGERKTEEETEFFLRELSPIMYEEFPNIQTGKYDFRLRLITDLTNSELIDHIEHLSQIAAEEYSLFIEDPKTL